MRYKVDASGYISAVSFGGYLDNCIEYTGKVPAGYRTLNDWASYSCIQAYYIDPKGDLTVDSHRQNELENLQAQEAVDNSPVLRKDIYETDELLNGQYIREVATGKVITLKDIKTIAPRVKITGIQPGYNKLSIYTQGKNMMECNAVSKVVSGVAFTKNASGSITVLGTAEENIEYVVADGGATTLFALKANSNYYLNLGGLQCELRYFDGETTAQQYIGASGLLKLPEHIEVTQVVIKIASGDSVNTTFYPQLEYGTSFTSYAPYKCKALEIDIGEVSSEVLLPSDTLYADDTLYPGTIPENIDYIVVENGKVMVSINGRVSILSNGAVGLFSDYDTIYSTKDVTLEVEYSDNQLLVDSLEFLQGKATTTNRFLILKDGSIQAHNGYFSGKIEADSGYFDGVVGGEIKGATIEIGSYFSVDEKGNCIANSFKSSNAQITGGSIVINSSSAKESMIKLNSGSNSTAMFPAGIDVKYGSNTASINATGISVTYLNEITNILPGRITVNSLYSYPTTTGIGVYSPFKVYASTTLAIGYTHYIQGTLECSGVVKCKGTGSFNAENNIVKLGGYSSMVGFFGNNGATKKSVSKIYSTSSATASSVAETLNKLLDALKAYNLIG